MSIILILSFTFSGCGDKQPPVITPNICPKIEILTKVEPISVMVDSNGSVVSESNTGNLINGASQLRKSETYYIKEITRYNEKFTKKVVDK